jgi:hypothetical protein
MIIEQTMLEEVLAKVDAELTAVNAINVKMNDIIDHQQKDGKIAINKNAIAVGLALEAQCKVTKEMHEKVVDIHTQIQSLRNEIGMMKGQISAIMSASFSTGPTT